MSGMRHPTISAWQRREDGSYAAEIDGWNLRVEWHPESTGGAEGHDGERGFTWAAERGGTEIRSDELFEEIEVAMGDAEAKTAPDPAAASDAAEPQAEGAHGHH
jgi:hypothetical protein